MGGGGAGQGRASKEHTEDSMAKHRATKHRTPIAWRLRRLENQWQAFTKPALRRRYKALQSLTAQNLKNYIKKIR